MKYSLDFTEIKKCDVLLLDRNSANLKFKNLNSVALSLKQINVKCLIKTFLLFFFKKKNF